MHYLSQGLQPLFPPVAPQGPTPGLFSLLPPFKRKLGAFAVGYAVEAVMMFFLATMTIAAPTLAVKQYEHIELLTNLEPERTVSPSPRVQHPRIELAQPAVKPKLVLPPDVQAPNVPESGLKLPETAVAPPKYVPVPQAAFEPQGNSSAQPTIKNRPASQAQTGGFGSPNGFAPNPNSLANRPNVAVTGSWDLPAGPGYGNGTGGAHGARGVIASAGFGNGGAGGGRGNGAGGQGHVQTTSFSPAAPVNDHPTRLQTAAARSAEVPVAIQSKPQPIYSAEARALKIEGEVLLEVRFAGDGKVTVVRVLRGLGHGLDEAAVRAAQGIHFTPAQRDGHPVDSTATLHIIFQLS